MIKISSTQVERWDFFEIALIYSENLNINPFIDVHLEAEFVNRETNNVKLVEGFYDGDNKWKIRFMPEELGKYYFEVRSNIKEFNGIRGEFESVKASENNRGPIKITNKYHFSYSDGKPFFVMGTTAYAWTYRPEEIREKTIQEFKKYGFNKIRMLVFPKYFKGILPDEYKEFDYDITYEPPCWPFQGEPGKFNFTKPNPIYFQNFEKCIWDLRKENIEADVILFHPYDNWGIAEKMTIWDMILYIRYMVNRLSAFRNIWWSLANEYDALPYDMNTWDVIGSLIKKIDPYQHLISVHNQWKIFPNKEWLTHLSCQHTNTYNLVIELKNKYLKPVIIDEYQYEGNLLYDWGNSSPEVSVLRHLLAYMAGAYATHGEVYVKNSNNRDLFWSYGGELIGESPRRLKFIKEIFESCPFQEMEIDYRNTDGHHIFSLSKKEEFYLLFFRYDMPGKHPIIGPLDGSKVYDVTLYDVWNCKVIEKFEMPSGAYRKGVKQWTMVKCELKK